eukprot:s900_g11.t2
MAEVEVSAMNQAVLSLTCSFFVLSFISLFMMSYVQKGNPVTTNFNKIALLVTAIAGTVYFCMAMGVGITKDAAGHVYWIRYVDWMFTTPLMLIELGILAGAQPTQTITLIALDETMLAFGVGSSFSVAGRWPFFMIGLLCFSAVAFKLFTSLQNQAMTQGGDRKVLYTFVANRTAEIWCMYPVMFALCECTKTFPEEIEVAGYAIADIFAKCGIPMMVWLLLEAVVIALLGQVLRRNCSGLVLSQGGATLGPATRHCHDGAGDVFFGVDIPIHFLWLVSQYGSGTLGALPADVSASLQPTLCESQEEWADEIFASMGKETIWSISQVRCPEKGCPPVETVITDLGVKAPKPGAGVYKVFKAFADVTKEDVEAALLGTASVGHGHGGHGDAHAAPAHGHSGDCCSGDGHGDGHTGHGDVAGHRDVAPRFCLLPAVLLLKPNCRSTLETQDAVVVTARSMTIWTIGIFSVVLGLRGAIACDCTWTNNGQYCADNDGSFCWRVCCPNSCDGGGWTVAYSANHCQRHGNVRQISCKGASSSLCGTRLSSSHFVGRGYHSIRLKAAGGPGVVSTFYLSNNGGLYDKTKTHPWVELDFEIMGNTAGGHSRIWTNMFTDIAVEHNDWITVPFDVTTAVHEYGFELSDNFIAFKVDGIAYRTVDIRNHQDVRSAIWSSSLQQFISVWGKSSSDPGEGIMEFRNAMGVLNGNHFPAVAEYIL